MQDYFSYLIFCYNVVFSRTRRRKASVVSSTCFNSRTIIRCEGSNHFGVDGGNSSSKSIRRTDSDGAEIDFFSFTGFLFCFDTVLCGLGREQ